MACSGVRCPMQNGVIKPKECSLGEMCDCFTPELTDVTLADLGAMFAIWYLCENDPEFRDAIEKEAQKYIKEHFSNDKCMCEERKS